MSRETNGKFRFRGDKRMCVCGHAARVHIIGSPHPCNNGVDGDGPCACASFRLSRRKKKYGNPCKSCKALFGHHHWFCRNRPGGPLA